jgi:nucleoside-diphosphate-sugar epimerase
MAKYLGKPAPSVKVPKTITGLVWRFESARTFLTGSTPELTREMAYTTGQKYTYSNEKLRKALGFEFTPVEQSIREICEFFLKDHRS